MVFKKSTNNLIKICETVNCTQRRESRKATFKYFKIMKMQTFFGYGALSHFYENNMGQPQ